MKAFFKYPILGVLAASLLSGCSAFAKQEAEIQTFAMDTIMNLKAEGKNATDALEQAEQEIHRLDDLFSITQKGSEIYLINANAGVSPVTVSDETAQLLLRAKELNQQTDNTFAVTIYPMVDAWGFMKEQKQRPSQQIIDKRLQLVNDSDLIVNNNQVELKQPSMAIDLGGIAKGYLSDRVTEILVENEISSAIISLGGNISAIGTRPDGKPWQVALQDPLDKEKYIGVFYISDLSVITSGGYQRFFEEDGQVYHHILDPKTGYPAQSALLSVSIICKDGTKADALSTALYVMGLEKAVAYWKEFGDFEAVFITDDKRVLATEGIADSFSFERDGDGYTFDTIARQ